MPQPMESPDMHTVLSSAARYAPPTLTPDCLEPEDLIELIENTTDTVETRRNMAHVIVCGYCHQAYAAMEKTLRLAAHARALQNDLVVSPPVTPATAERSPAGNIFMETLRRIFRSPAFALTTVLGIVIGWLSATWIRHPSPSDTRLNSQVIALRAQLRKKAEQANEESVRRAAAEAQLQQLSHSSREVVAANEAGLLNYYRSHRLVVPPVPGIDDGAVRGPNHDSTMIALIEPMGTFVRTAQPVLRWKPLPGTTTYTVVVTDVHSSIMVQSVHVTQPWWRVSPALRWGHTYEWQVMAQQQSKNVSSKIARFQELDAVRAEKLNVAQEVSTLSEGIRFAQVGLLQEARSAFEAIPKTSKRYGLAHKLLQDLPVSVPDKNLSKQ